MTSYQLPPARIIANNRTPHPVLEDQVFNAPDYATLDDEKSHGATKFIVRNISLTSKPMLEYAMQGHPDRGAHYKVASIVADHKEHQNLAVEVTVKPKSEKLPIAVLGEVFFDLSQFFSLLDTKINLSS